MHTSSNETSNGGWRDLKDMPDDLHVLFIEGYGRGSFMQNKYQTYKSFDGNPRFAHISTFRVWCSYPCYWQDDDIPSDAFGVERCQQQIESGKYHAIVVLDCCVNEDEFQRSFGSMLQAFVAAGGVVAFPASESCIVSTLKELFDVKWKRGSYYRTFWGPCLDVNERNIHYSFGNGHYSKRIIKYYSAKANTIMDVPYHERCFGVTARSKRSWREPIPVEDENYETVTAMHEYGKGVIAYFGDVNAEDHSN